MVRGRAAGFSKGLPQSPGWLRIVQVLQGFQGNLDKDRNTLKVNSRESAQLLMHLLLINSHWMMGGRKGVNLHCSLKRCSTGLTKGYVYSQWWATDDASLLLWRTNSDVICRFFFLVTTVKNCIYQFDKQVFDKMDGNFRTTLTILLLLTFSRAINIKTCKKYGSIQNNEQTI